LDICTTAGGVFIQMGLLFSFNSYTHMGGGVHIKRCPYPYNLHILSFDLNSGAFHSM